MPFCSGRVIYIVCTDSAVWVFSPVYLCFTLSSPSRWCNWQSNRQACVDSMTCYVEATRSLSDEFGDAVQGDISLISGSYLIILVYTIINLSGRPLLKSRILLSLGAIMVRERWIFVCLFVVFCFLDCFVLFVLLSRFVLFRFVGLFCFVLFCFVLFCFV